MNQLANALSPYLRQHKNNPVHWQEWTEAAFNEAKKRDVPIFLSIGYAACHWCHVMTHESFENREIADYLNQNFVSIKVDREERPDIDNVYMQALMNFTGHGGWPMSVFLTPDAKPFFAGTYFPDEPRHGLPGFMQILRSVNQVWREQRAEIDSTTATITQRLNAKIQAHDTISLPDWQSLTENIPEILQRIDDEQGGLYGAPKFPQISLWQWLFTLGVYAKNARLMELCYLTARKICQGGIYDHLAGGWMRYSVDENWLVPHFEKMLYDNAQIISWLTALYAYRPEPLFFKRISETIHWLKRAMQLGSGAFAASLDADSEGGEGKYYVWQWQEIKALLGKDAENFLNYYGAKPEGNWEGKNILHLNHRNTSEIPEEKLQQLKQLLFNAREKRVKPAQDDKVLLDWNALLIKALAEAGQIFQQNEWLQLAIDNYAAVKKLLYHHGEWFRCYRENRYQHLANLEDLANLIAALISLHLATGEDHYLSEAENLTAQLNEEFFDTGNHLYSLNSKKTEKLIANPQPIFDGALPAGNGVMAVNLIQLALITANPIYSQQWENLMLTIAPLLQSPNKYSLSHVCLALAWFMRGNLFKGDFLRQFPLSELTGKVPPLILFLQQSGAHDIQCCDFQRCFAQLKDDEALKKFLLEIFKG